MQCAGAKRVVAKINDPLRAEAYADLGIATLCRTNLMQDAIHEFIGKPRQHPPGVVSPTGSHPGGEHHGTPSGSGGDSATLPETLPTGGYSSTAPMSGALEA